MRKTKFLKLKLREASFISRALLSSRHPVLAHLIPMRRCNLACGYCNEYDHTSKPIDLEIIKSRLNKLADLGTSIVTISGGEPMMHPELDQIIHHIRVRGMIAGLISNGYYFTPERIKRLNKAGLEYLQISIDNVEPDEVSRKSLRVLDKKLRYLSEFADFHVNINSVIGGGIKNPDDALAVARRAVELGFSTTVGVIHDVDGTLKPLSAKDLPAGQETRKQGSCALELVPGQHRRRQALQLALPCRRSLSLHLRGRPGALVLAATRLSRNSVGPVHNGRLRSGVQD
jgi:MoaA/NifB/PqqE/SkfB family radical SAM enzyme